MRYPWTSPVIFAVILAIILVPVVNIKIVQFSWAQSTTTGDEKEDKNHKGPCSASEYSKGPDECAPLSDCKRVDSGPSQGAYECPGSSSLICPAGACGTPAEADQPLTCGPDVNGIPQISCGPSDVCDPDLTDQATDVGKQEVYQKGPWKFGYEIVDHQGLVLHNMIAGSQGVFGSVAVPHFQIQFPQSKIIRFDATDCKSPIVVKPNSPKDGRDSLLWTYSKKFDEPDIKGTLRISYEYLVDWKVNNNCEYFGADCYRFIPKVSFQWSGTNPAKLSKFTAYYKFDYGLVGMALTKDSNNFFGNAFINTGRQAILTKETKFNAVTNNNDGEYDSMHTAHKGQSVVTPGCRTLPHMSWWMAFPAFDCVHVHWRWSGTGVIYKGTPLLNWGWFPNIDVMLEPSTDEPIPDNKRGEPYLVPDQTIDVAIVKFNEQEIDPDDPMSLVNDETIATTPIEMVPTGSGPTYRPSLDILDSAEHIIVWYAASVNEKNSDTFFRHGIYMVDPKEEYKVTTTSSLPQSLEKMNIDLGSSQFGNILLPSSKQVREEILAHLTEAISDKYWQSDGTRLIPEKGEPVFAELAQAATLAQKIKTNETPQTSQSMDLAISAMLSIIDHAVINAMKNDTDYIHVASSNLVTSGDSTKIDSVFAKNEALKLAVQYYAAAIKEPDLSKSSQIIDNYRLAWLNTVKGMREVSDQLGILPPAVAANSTNTTTGIGQQSSQQQPKPPTFGSNNTASTGLITTDNKSKQPVVDLTGIWTADDGGTYYIKQLGNMVWWLGMSGNNGESFTNIFRGMIQDNNKIDGEWTDVPKGDTRNHGILFLNISSNFSNGTQLQKIEQTGGFGGSVWTMREGESISSSVATTSESGQKTEPSSQGGIHQNKSTTQNIPPGLTASSDDYLEYQNPEFRLLMKYPTNWVKQENSDNVVFTSPAESPQDKYLESLYVYHMANIPLFPSADETLKKNVQAAIDFRKSYKNFQLLSNNEITFNDKPAGQIVYTYSDQNIGDVKAMEIIAVDGNDKYNILFIANTGQYSSTLPAAQKMVDSIQIAHQDDRGSSKSSSNTLFDSGTETRQQGSGTTTDTNEAHRAGQHGFKIADETAKIKAEDYQFYNFVINQDISTAQLTGSYKEKNGNDVTVTLYEVSYCSAPATSADFDITTCNEIHSQTSSFGNIQLQLSPGKYYLTLASADQLHDLKVIVNFDVTNG